ncbi:EamA family transporter [Rhodobacteraceae bacterium]|nr:EamA family transporter [Paracoccaceae bacterium]
MTTRSKATLLGLSAVALWSLLALFTVGSAPVPALQLNAMCFTMGSVIGLIWMIRNNGFAMLKGVPLRIYIFGTVGLFGYHFLYFSALRLAPPAQAGLIAYLWPLLIVLFSGLLPGERLRGLHILGALIAFGGAILVFGDVDFDAEPEAFVGYALAALCALTWSSYSVLSRKMGTVPTAAVTVFCIATALLSLLAHLALEDTVWPETSLGWVSIAALGAGPVGLAFYTWDVGVKKGDIQLLGTASYAAPLLSTLILVAFGFAAASANLILAAAMIAFGAGLAALASRSAKVPASTP